MIYVSTSCSKKTNIRESIQELVNLGIKNIELSGGTEHYESLEDDLINLQIKYDLNFLIHNYFPPPKQHFVLNLASNSQAIQDTSLKHIKQAIMLSEKLRADKYAFHAGFLMDPDEDELGENISKKKLISSEDGMANFIKNFKNLQSKQTGVKLYIENNVLSYQNYNNYGCNPFMLTNRDAYAVLKLQTDFNLLLDVAHLKVSCNSLGLNFQKELMYLSSQTDYLHLSDNDGKSDSNLEIKKDSNLFDFLQECDLKNKTISMEIYSGLNKIVDSIELINPLVDN